MDIRHILVVIDASREEQQPALERATQLLEHYQQASLTLMLCDYIPALDGGRLLFLIVGGGVTGAVILLVEVTLDVDG